MGTGGGGAAGRRSLSGFLEEGHLHPGDHRDHVRHVDRQILTILMEPIRKEFNFSDLQLGLLGGLAFAVLYSTLGIPLARLADRKNRVTIISISLFVWSLFTVLTGRAQNFLQLFAARVFYGVKFAIDRDDETEWLDSLAKLRAGPILAG